MRLQHRKVLTPVNAQFLNNSESWLQKPREDACSPNNSILRAYSFVGDVINIIHCNIFHICTLQTDQSSNLSWVNTDCNVWKTLCDKYNPQLRSALHPFVHLLVTHSAVLFNRDRSCFEKGCELLWGEEEVQKKHFLVFTTACAHQPLRRSDRRKWLQ